MSTPGPDAGNAIAVVGAGMAGLSAVRALRTLGYSGRLVLVGEERHAPYDRPPLSKEFLAGGLSREALDLAAPADDELGVELRTGTAAVGLDPATRRVRLASGEEVGGKGVVIATGARARAFPGSAAFAGVHTVRTVDDAVSLRADLQPGARLVVVGAGFIGAEVAATAKALGLDVTLVEAAPVPLAAPLGEQMGSICAELHADHGVQLITGAGVAGLVGTGGAGPGSGPAERSGPIAEGRVRAVRLADGRDVPADTVVIGIGSVPSVEWMAGSGLDVTGGVLTDRSGATGVPGIVATGDCTRRPDPWAGRVVRQEHWTSALQHPVLAAAALLGGSPPPQPAHAAVPYFWSDQYGVRLQFAGCRRPGDEPEVVDGDVRSRTFAAVYRRKGTPVAVLAMNSPRVFGRWRRELAATAVAAPAIAT
jgi:NADPH-dependent 2,4-dienoyl-CoA reductase/sulfur reductase-like enzyme